MTIRKLIAGTAAGLAAALAASAASADLANPSFETGDIGGWSKNYSEVFVLTEIFDRGQHYQPTDGGYLGILYTGAGAGVYSTLTQTFTTTGGLFEGDAAFATGDGGFQNYNDDAYVRIFGAGPAISLFTANSNGIGGPNHGTPWTHFSVQLDPGTYTVQAGVRNFPDNLVYSYMVVDNFRLTEAAIPEPGTWALLISGFFGTGLALRGRRRLAIA